MSKLGEVVIVSTIFHPIILAKTLIQIGYEPLPPYSTTTLFGNPVYMYPNVLKYIGHIYSTDGFIGLYRGLGCGIVSGIVNITAINTVQAYISGKPFMMDLLEVCDEIDGDKEVDEVSKLVRDTFLETISRCAGVLCSQPFYVIYIRSMAQFVGRENRFSSIFDAIPDIWKNEGISGFFAGLVPRLLGEVLTIWIANTLAYAFNTFIFSVNQRPIRVKYIRSVVLLAEIIARQITYPFTVVSAVMAVNGSSLEAASKPTTPFYINWITCWNHLSKTQQLKRGSSLFWRKYHGAQIVTTQGIVMPPLDIT